MDHGPFHVQEFAQWIATLIRAMVTRFGEERASSFWFRVATEPNTRPGHWNDSNTKYVDEYAAVSRTVKSILPRALVGLANMGADGSSWETRVMPMAQGIVNSSAPVDFIAMSCYGRGTHHMKPPYGIASAVLCAERLERMRKLGGARWAKLPAQSMEYGLQQNALGIVDESPDVFGGAWMLATSVALARHNVERAFQWPAAIETAFAHDDGACSPKISTTPCALYGGTAWVRAQAGHLFGTEAAAVEAFVLGSLAPGSNATADPESEAAEAGKGGSVTSVDGIGGWVQSGDHGDTASDDNSEAELRLLLTAFSPSSKTRDLAPVTVQVTVERPSNWQSATKNGGGGLLLLQMRTATLNRTTSTFDTILSDAQLHQPSW